MRKCKTVGEIFSGNPEALNNLSDFILSSEKQSEEI